MGEARRRGTYEERKAEGIARREAWERHRAEERQRLEAERRRIAAERQKLLGNADRKEAVILTDGVRSSMTTVALLEALLATTVYPVTRRPA